MKSGQAGGCPLFYFVYFAWMALPFFYKEDISANDTAVVLDEDTSKHVVQVLRMKPGERLKLTNGKGGLFVCEIMDDHRKRCGVKIIEQSEMIRQQTKVCIAISPLKNNGRFEWFLEKATEIGITDIVPLICERTEKSQLKTERLKGILVSAMLQSQQAWLPLLQETIKYADYIKKAASESSLQKFIAHCVEEKKYSLPAVDISNNVTILIGPEGDFTHDEIALALSSGFEAVTLGETRLRTETAGMVAAVLLTNHAG